MSECPESNQQKQITIGNTLGTNIVSSRGCDELLDTIPFTSMAVQWERDRGKIPWVGGYM